MKWFKQLFGKQTKTIDIPPMPPWKKIVDMLYDKHLDAFGDEVVKVIYSKDKSMRYVILKNEKNFLTYQLEAIYQFDDDEWQYICSNKNALPAMWEPFLGIDGRSVFSNEYDLIRELKTEPEYKMYFE